MPSCFGSPTSWLTMLTLNPAPSSLAMAAPLDRPTTLGTTTFGATPLLTQIVTLIPSGAEAPPPGSCLNTTPAGLSDGPVWTSAVKFAVARAFTAASCVMPTTFGTVPPGAGGGVGKPRTGCPDMATDMKSCQIGAANVPPKGWAPCRTGAPTIEISDFG